MKVEEVAKVEEILFKFTCTECGNEDYSDAYNLLYSGHPLCCDEEMEVDDKCFRKIKH